MTDVLPAPPTAAPSSGSDPDASSPRAARTMSRRPWMWWTVALLVIACCCSLIDVAVENHLDIDPVRLITTSARVLMGLRWQYTGIVVVLAAAHYAAAAVATRAAAGLPLPLGETVLVQLAAAAANRLTPLGAGGAAVNIRYLSRRGQSSAAAVGAVTVLTGVGALADVAALAALVVGGRWIGLRGLGGGMPTLISRASGLLRPLQSPPYWVGTALVLAGAVTTPAGRRILHRCGAFLIPLRQLLRHPTRLAALGVASASTTVLLGVAFIASAAAVGSTQPGRPFGTLLVEYMIAGAAGAAIPIPAGIGTTEIALIAVLGSAGMPVGHATEAVLLFRVVTFWLPALVGVAAARHLRRTDAL